MGSGEETRRTRESSRKDRTTFLEENENGKTNRAEESKASLRQSKGDGPLISFLNWHCNGQTRHDSQSISTTAISRLCLAAAGHWRQNTEHEVSKGRLITKMKEQIAHPAGEEKPGPNQVAIQKNTEEANNRYFLRMGKGTALSYCTKSRKRNFRVIWIYLF